MKKSRSRRCHRVVEQKIWNAARLCLLFTCVFQLSLSAVTLSQERKVDLNLRDVSLETLFREIQRQTGYYFIFNYEELGDKRVEEVRCADEEVSAALNRVLRGFGYRCSLENDIIIVSPDLAGRLQQQRPVMTISGRVTDERGTPLAGVSVAVKGAITGTSSDKNGNFRIVLLQSEGITLVFTFIGMERREVKYAGQASLQVVMREAVRELEEVIVSTGYQRFSLRETTSAIQYLPAEEILVPGLTSIDQMLEGYVPGMTFMQNSGQVGAVPRIRIRGTSTVLGNQEPVWVLDNVVIENPVNVSAEQINDLDFVNLLGNAISGINPNDIESITILKDASATALYGPRAANGVIVVTTKQGRQGPPELSYSLAGTFTRRPHYSDRSVFMMNSRERVAFSRELLEKRVIYPHVEHWLGYEKAMLDYWKGDISYDQMRGDVGRHEAMNTDWFGEMMQNSLSNKHTVSLSGGSPEVRYYVSAGYSDARGSIKDEANKQYTASMNVVGTYNRWTIRFNLNGNVNKKYYTPADVEVTRYAYETTRAFPARGDDGRPWFYPRQAKGNEYADFSILNEKANTSQEIRSSGLTATAGLDFRVKEGLKATLTASYNTSNTTQEVWHGENSFYAGRLRLPPTSTTDMDVMPYGGELLYQNTEQYSYTLRGQVDMVQALDADRRHVITAAVGGELSSTQYYGLNETYRGYLKERGKKMAQVNPVTEERFARWLATDVHALGMWNEQLTNRVGPYATVAYTFNNLYTINVNGRFDASNRFGSRANEQLAPIWSVSGRWNTKDDVLQNADWVDNLSLHGSFGYQGNMLDNISSRLVIQRGGIDADFGEYESNVYSYANPDLRWEKTSSYNATMDFSFFRRFLAGSVSYFYKRTKDAFFNKGISSINGVSTWVVNTGVLENHGVELALRFTLVDTRSRNANGFRWNMTTNFGQVTNNVPGPAKDKTLTNAITYQGYLDGTLEVQGRPLHSFYSYKYQHLNPLNGAPVFYGSDRMVYAESQRVDLLEKYQGMSLTDIFSDVMRYSGTRVPVIQGGVQHALAWGRFAASVNMAYSFGSKIRLLQMYPNVSSEYRTIAPQPMANVRREFLKRWQNPGDEQFTNVPGVISGATFDNTLGGRMWWNQQVNMNGESIGFAGGLWQMYDKSDLRVVSGNFVKIQSASVRYNLPEELCRRVSLRTAYVSLSGTNLYTFASKKLKGQDPATQDGTAPTINMSLRPTYSLNLNVSF
ncbi:MAG: SusC/RagA family TonB-linked outer membrane protein [Odoribacteraceae bacterium]|jgi:TonB-linked SusC/RagA family outer membrane protein|nr:SusC/RagA family TonB-linked outer membrane protein [Odoribacteraceae bacterium]